MAGLHPTQSGSLFQEDRPDDFSGESYVTAVPAVRPSRSTPPSSPPSPPPPSSPNGEVVTSLANRDYVVLASHLRRMAMQLDKVRKILALIESDSFRQPRCLWGGEVRSYYLAPRQLAFESACFKEHGVENLGELLTFCHELLASRPADPVLEIALESLRDARRIYGQMRRV